MSEIVFYSVGGEVIAAYDATSDEVLFAAVAFPPEIPRWELVAMLTRGVGEDSGHMQLFCLADDAQTILEHYELPDAVKLFSILEVRFRSPETLRNA